MAGPPGHWTGNPTHTQMQVFCARDRKWTGSSSSPKVYGSDRGSADAGELGNCYVSIPPGHKRGEIERPKWWKAEFQENPEEHLILLSVERLQPDGFYSKLKYVIGQPEQEQAFVFIHGYNVTFEQAAWRTAQMAYDLGFDGAPVMYNRPAQGELLRYPADETNAQWTQPHLARFLDDLRTRSRAKKIHLIVHSMGARPLPSALREMLAAEWSKVFNQIVLTAPDIDRQEFEERIAPRLVPGAERITIYVSANDMALVASRKFHDDPRLGEGGANRVAFPTYTGINVIDAFGADTSVIGHIYYGENSPVLRDLGHVHAGVPAGDTRPRLRAATGYFDLLED